MSAYVVQDEVINKISTYLHDPRREYEAGCVREALERQGCIGDTWAEKLGNAMFELNCNAVDARYGDNQAKEFRPLDYQFKRTISGSGYDVYDGLGTWLYQCAEGDIPENNVLYKALDRIYNNMAHKFFRDLRERKG